MKERDLIEQEVKAEWQPTMCDFCHLYGHSDISCKKKMAKENNSRPPLNVGKDVDSSTIQEKEPSTQNIPNQHADSEEGWTTPSTTTKAPEVNTVPLLMQNNFQNLQGDIFPTLLEGLNNAQQLVPPNNDDHG